MDRAEAVQLLGRLHAAQGTFYAGGDEAPVRALLTDDVHWYVPGRNAVAGVYHGVDAVLATSGAGAGRLCQRSWVQARRRSRRQTMNALASASQNSTGCRTPGSTSPRPAAPRR